MNNKTKALYLLWVTTHFIIYVTSGNFLTDFDSSFYPFTKNIYHRDYDFSEFLIYTILPISLFYVFKLWNRDKKNNSYLHNPIKTTIAPNNSTIKSESISNEISSQLSSSQVSLNTTSEIKYDSFQNTKSVPVGIRGWLLFFVVTIVFSAPIFSFIMMLGQLSDPYDNFSYYPKLKTAIIVESIVISLILIYGIVVGLYLLSKSASAKKLVIQYLSVRIILMIAVELFLLSFLENTLPKFRYEMIGYQVLRVVFSEIVFFLIWFIYFQRSKRVANTFIH